MKRVLLVFSIVCLLHANVNAQVLYKVSGNNLLRPSYIIGTHHLANVHFLEQIPGIADALDNTEQVYGEVAINDSDIAEFQKYMVLPEGRTIKDVLTDRQFAKLNKFMLMTIGDDFNNPIIMQNIGYFTPKALGTQLTAMLFLIKHPGEFDPDNQFDNYFQRIARNANKPVKGLETINYQGELLYKSNDEKRDIELLMCLCDNLDWNVLMLERMTKAYYDQDLTEMSRIAEDKLNNNCDSTPKEDEQLVSNRNKNWIKVMPKIMAEHPTFFALGALHLTGTEGIIALLEKAGYIVEGVK